MTDIKNLNREEITDLLTSWGEKRYRIDQLIGWLYERNASSWEEMSSIERVSGEARPSRGVEKSCSGLAADTWDEGEMSHT